MKRKIKRTRNYSFTIKAVVATLAGLYLVSAATYKARRLTAGMKKQPTQAVAATAVPVRPQHIRAFSPEALKIDRTLNRRPNAVETAAAPKVSSLSAKEIMQKNEEARRVKTMQASAKLLTSGGAGGDKTKEFLWWRELTGDNVHFNTLTRFQSPAEVRGEAILFLEREGGDTDVQLYLPSFKKVRRVEAQQQSGSFMGSEFSYSDLGTPKAEEYTYKLVKEELCPGETKVKCYVIESTPANETVKDSTGTSRSQKWIRQDNFMDVKGEYWNEAGELWKRMTASDIKEVDPREHKFLAHKIRMENVKNGRSTSLEFSHVQVNQDIPDSTFSVQNLSRDK